jgi:hypothetical protein
MEKSSYFDLKVEKYYTACISLEIILTPFEGASILA